MKIKKFKNKICSIKITTFQPNILKKIINILKIFETKKLRDSLLFEYQTLPIQIKKFTVQRSPHVFKKAREQFELRTYRYLISIKSSIPIHDSLNNLNTISDSDALNDYFKAFRNSYILNYIVLKLMEIDGISIQVNSVFFFKVKSKVMN